MPERTVQRAGGVIGEATNDEQEIVSRIRLTLRNIAVTKSTTKAVLAKLTERAFEQEFPVVNADNRLANAIARGISARQKLMEAEGGSYSAEEAAEHLGVSKAAILKRYQKRQLLGWRLERQNAVRFPVWQFSESKVLPGLEQVLAALNERSRLDDFGRILFFLSNIGFLDGKRPLDLLRSGHLNKVLEATQGYGG
jgi:hypothetical protein